MTESPTHPNNELMLTSLSNPKVKLVRSLSRRRARYAARQFIVEGVRGLEEAQRAGITPALVFFTAAANADRRARGLLIQLQYTSVDVQEVSDTVMKEISNTETPPGILAVLPFVDLALPPQPQFVLILDAVRDPGNVGTILRSAWAAGVDSLVFAPSTADPYNDKVVRAAMGAHFHVPIMTAQTWEDIAKTVRSIPRIHLADAQAEIAYSDADWSRPVALIVGGEAEGASAGARDIATARIRIPMPGGAESLNAAMAATILLFHAAR